MLDYLELSIKSICTGQSTSSIFLFQAIVPKASTRMIRALLEIPKPIRLNTGATVLQILYGGTLAWPYISGLGFTDQGHPTCFWLPPILYSYTQRYMKDIANLMKAEGVNPSETWLAQGLKDFVRKEELGQHEDLDDYGDLPHGVALIVRRSAHGLYDTRKARKVAGEV